MLTNPGALREGRWEDIKTQEVKKLQCAGKLELTRFMRFPSPEVYLFVFLDLFIFFVYGCCAYMYD